MSCRRFAVLGGIALVCGLLALSASAGSAAVAGKDEAVAAPASVESISCPAVGECVAGGFYLEGYRSYVPALHGYVKARRRVGFVVSEANGRWGSPIPVRYASGGRLDEVHTISCAAAGDCAAAGYYEDSHYNEHAVVVGETNGKWGEAVAVPGFASRYAEVTSISCAAAGDCAAGGYYEGRHFSEHAFLVSETNGKWGKAIEVPGMAALSTGNAGVASISCAAPGECAAGGAYRHGTDYHAFVVDESHGVWRTAVDVPGTATLGGGHGASLISISCPASGECAAAGTYAAGTTTSQAFLVAETNHAWGDAIEVPGIAALNHAGDAAATTISCPAVGQCAAGGYVAGPRGENGRGFVVDETNGTWGDAIDVPGLSALGRAAHVDSISCAAAGECAASGDYKQPRAVNDGHYGAAFVASETNGTWGNAITVPGTLSLNSSGNYDFPAASAVSVSCAGAGDCAAGGYWYSGSTNVQPRVRRPRAFVLGETNGTWGKPVPVRHRLAHCVVVWVVGKRLPGAETTLNDFGCRLGKVTWAASSTVGKGRIIAQSPNPGPTLRAGATVAVTASKG